MSCNGCRVLRKGCSETCALRTCLQWIESPEAQGHATLFLAKFFGRSDLMSFISSVPQSDRPALFQSLLFEACGRTVNPVNGAVGLLWSGNWHVCQAAVETVLAGGVLRPLPEIFAGVLTPILDESSDAIVRNTCNIGKSVYSQFRPFMHDLSAMNRKSDMDVVNARRIGATLKRHTDATTSFGSGESETTCFGSSCGEKKKLLNLFV